MKYILRILLIAVAMVTAIPSFAVSDKEMEAARAMAAKHYLRYANNGSAYLDDLKPSSMDELNKALKSKEKENIKSFNAVAVPKDYASWDKAKLVEYWSNTFFKSPGLKEDGKKCLGILAKSLNKINVGAPAPKSEATPQPAAAEQKPAATAQPVASAPDAAAAPAEEVPAAQEPADLEAISAQADADNGIADEEPKRSSNTGLYVAILVVLVGIVVWLVIYASKSMKETGVAGAGGKAAENEIREARKAAKEESNKLREQYAGSLATKNDEIKQLKARVEELEAQLDRANEALEREKARNAAMQRQPQPAPQPAPQPKPAVAEQRQPQQTQAQRQPQQAQSPRQPQARQTALPPVVYLGYVNQRGLFVKASRSLNQESSVYYMDIPDGHHGTFMVVDDTEVLDRVLADPEYWLGGGCVIENPEDADIAAEIITLEAGEAVFADNSCRVTKKARIKFI